MDTQIDEHCRERRDAPQSTRVSMEEVNSLLQRLQSIAIREDGQALVEYSLILALISVVAVGLLTTIGGDVQNTLQSVINAL
jgi:pilus assembly protein Flp/PilA